MNTELDPRDNLAFKAWVKNIPIDKLSELATAWAYDESIYNYGYSFKKYLSYKYTERLKTLPGYIPYTDKSE